MLTPEEVQIIEYGKSIGKTPQQSVQALANYRKSNPNAQAIQVAQQVNKSKPETIQQNIATGINELAPMLDKRAENIAGSIQKYGKGEQGVGSLAYQVGSELAGSFVDTISVAAKRIGSLITSQLGIKDEIKKDLAGMANDLANVEYKPGTADAIKLKDIVSKIQTKADFFSANHPELAANLKATGNYLNAALQFYGLGEASKATEAGLNTAKTSIQTGIKTSADLAQSGIDATKNVIKSGVAGVESAAGKVGSITGKVIDSAGTIGDGLAQIPGRISTNIADKQATAAAIKSLPTQAAQNAVRNGISMADVNTVRALNLTAQEKSIAKELLRSAKDFASGMSKNNPIEVVGKPIVNSIKELNTEAGRIGKQIGEVANTLPSVSSQELKPAVFDALRRVPGLRGIKLTPSGVLDFTDTVLASSLSKSDREAVNEMFVEATTSGTGKSKHLLRQELFEILGGKKGSLQVLTSTQEDAFEAVRKGLANVLDSKNKTYKALNEAYATTIKPVNDMRKLLKAVPGTLDEDILNMSAGLLARRLTSNSISQGQIKAVLNSIDTALANAGKTGVNVEKLQELYNIFNTYYEISSKTGFQGQIKGAEISVNQAVGTAIKEVAGETQAVRQKALENLLKEVLK